MAEFFPKSDDEKYHVISQDAKDIVEEQGNLEAHEIVLVADAVQNKSCYKYATPRHTYCKCGLVLPGASDEVKKTSSQKRHQLFQYADSKPMYFQTRKAQRENKWSQRRLPMVVQCA